MAKRQTTATVLHRKRTPYQRIELRQDPRGLFLTLNAWPQVHSREERLYHEALATMPMLLARRIARVAILGGGDGLAARNVLEFPDVAEATLVELDPGMIELCSKLPQWTTLTRGSLSDRRLKVVVGDAIDWLRRAKGTFDVIIHDLEMVYTDQPTALSVERMVDFFTTTYAKLSPGGVWVMTVPDDTDPALTDGVFMAHAERLPPAIHAAYARERTVIGKTRLLLQAQFTHVRSWSIRFPILGPHTQFYISNSPLRTLQRKPPFPLLTRQADGIAALDMTGISRRGIPSGSGVLAHGGQLPGAGIT